MQFPQKNKTKKNNKKHNNSNKKKNKKQKRTRLPVANSHQSYPAGVLWLIQTLFFPSNIYQSLLEETKAFHSQMDYNALQALTAGCAQKTSKGRQPTLFQLHSIFIPDVQAEALTLPPICNLYSAFKKKKKIKTSSNVKLIPCCSKIISKRQLIHQQGQAL